MTYRPVRHRVNDSAEVFVLYLGVKHAFEIVFYRDQVLEVFTSYGTNLAALNLLSITLREMSILI